MLFVQWSQEKESGTLGICLTTHSFFIIKSIKLHSYVLLAITSQNGKIIVYCLLLVRVQQDFTISLGPGPDRRLQPRPPFTKTGDIKVGSGKKEAATVRWHFRDNSRGIFFFCSIFQLIQTPHETKTSKSIRTLDIMYLKQGWGTSQGQKD